MILIVGCGSKTPTPDPRDAEIIALRDRITALEKICQPLMTPEATAATTLVNAVSAQAAVAQQKATVLGPQLDSIKADADKLSASLQQQAAQDRIKALEAQIAQLTTAVQTAQAAAVAADAKASKIKIANAIYSPIAPKKWCKCSAD